MQKPKHITVKDGNVSVRIYRRERSKNGQTYRSFDVVDCSGGKRKFITFADEAKARKKAQDIGRALATGQAAVLDLTVEDVASYRRSLELIHPTGLALEVVAATFATCHARLGGASLEKAVDYFVTRNLTPPTEKTVSQVVAELLAAKTADGVSAVYLKDLKFRLGKFSEDFAVKLADVQVSYISGWLRKLTCGPRGRNNYRRSIVTLFRFAMENDYLPDNHIRLSKVAEAKNEEMEIELFSSTELAKLLVAAQLDPDNLKPGMNRRYVDHGLVGYLTLGAFAGLRTAEIERQLWEDILWDSNLIRVTDAKGHTPRKRLVPLHPNLRAWLEPRKRASGKICSYGRISDAVARLSKRAGVAWKHNALRHSYISHRVKETNNVAQVSLEAGNSPRKVHSNYRELITDPEETKRWFSITPDNVQDMLKD